MSYHFTSDQDYTHFSSGRVFYNLPGHPAFPVRLVSEIFQCCLDVRRLKGVHGPVRLFDPCCGGAYHLAVLAFLHWEMISGITVSDIDPDALAVARRNLALLTPGGMAARMIEIQQMQVRFGKESHTEALISAGILHEMLVERLKLHFIPTHIFTANALDADAICFGVGQGQVDVVITDIPYGNQSTWQGVSLADDPIHAMLDSLYASLADGGVVAVAGTKEQKVAHAGYQRVEKMKIGKRLVTILAKGANGSAA